MRKLRSTALIASLGVAAATLSVTAEAHPYVAFAPPGVYAPYYAHRPYFYPRYVRYGYGPEFNRYGYFHGGRWCRSG